MSEEIEDVSAFLAGHARHLTAAAVAQPIEVTIARVVRTTEREMAETRPIELVFVEDVKPWQPCLGMRRLIARLWGTRAADWQGRRLRLYCEPTVSFGGDQVGGIRICGMSHIDGTQNIAVAESRKKKRTYKIEPIEVATQPRPLSPELTQLLTDYDVSAAELDAWCVSLGRPAASVMPDRQRAALAQHLRGEGGEALVLHAMAARGGGDADRP